jgi:hypothetical protein
VRNWLTRLVLPVPEWPRMHTRYLTGLSTESSASESLSAAICKKLQRYRVSNGYIYIYIYIFYLLEKGMYVLQTMAGS